MTTEAIWLKKLEEYTPLVDGRSYYSVRLGDIWALILDCGECCDDNYPNTGTRFAIMLLEWRKLNLSSE